MYWKLESHDSKDGRVIYALNTLTNEKRLVQTVHYSTIFEKLSRILLADPFGIVLGKPFSSMRERNETRNATMRVHDFCMKQNSAEMKEKYSRPTLPDKPFLCGKCKNDSWKLIARRWNTGYFLQFHCVACGHSDNIISYESSVSNIEKLVDMNMLPAGSMYDSHIKYFSSRDKDE